MTNVTDLSEYRKDETTQGEFLDLLAPELKKDGFVQPLPSTVFNRVAALRAKARENELASAKPLSELPSVAEPAAEYAVIELKGSASADEDLLQG